MFHQSGEFGATSAVTMMTAENVASFSFTHRLQCRTVGILFEESSALSLKRQVLLQHWRIVDALVEEA